MAKISQQTARIPHRFPIKPYGSPVRIRRSTRAILIAVGLLFCFIYGFAFALLAPYLVIPLLIPIVFLGALTIWALPETDKAPTGVLEFLFFSVFIALVMWPNYLAIAIPGLPWITVSRLTAFPLLFALLISLSVSANFRSTIAAAFSTTPVLWRLVLAFVLLQAVSIGLSANKSDSVDKFINAQIGWTTVFVAGCYVFTKNGRTERFVGILCAMAIVLCLIGVWENHLGRLVWAGHIPSFLKVNDDTVNRILTGASRSDAGPHRVQATFSTSLGLSEHMALITPFLFYFIANRYPPVVRIGAALAIPLVVFIVIVTQARVGAVGLTLDCLAYPIVLAVLQWRKTPNSLASSSAIYLSPLFCLIALVIAYIVPGIRYRVLGSGASEYSTQTRIDQMHMGIPKIISHPWGFGIGQGAAALGYTNLAGVLTIDSGTLRITLEYGVLGLVIYYGIFISAMYYAGREIVSSPNAERETGLLVPIGISLFVYIFIRSAFAQEDNLSLMFMLMGMLAALIYRHRNALSSSRITPGHAAEA
jgi:uncharacterized membrane protein